MQRLLLLLFAALALSAQSVHRLDAGAESMTITDSGTSLRLALPLRGAHRWLVTLWNARYEMRGPGSPVDCSDPCSIAFDRTSHGTWYAYTEALDASDVRVSAGLRAIPQRIVSESPALPLEVVGGAPMTRRVQVTSSGSGPVRLWAISHLVGYEGKARVRLNSGAYQNINKANVTFLRDARNWTYPSMEFGAAVLEWTLPLSTAAVSGTNYLDWQFASQKKGSSGFRVLEWNLLAPDVTVSGTDVSGSTVAVTTSEPHLLTTGNAVMMIDYPGKAWRVNGLKKNITVTSPTTFTFTIPESDGKLPETKAYTGVFVAKALIDPDSFTQVSPADFVAPAGSNASTGATLANAENTLLDPFHPGYSIKAACTSCHFAGLRDLKRMGFSPHSIAVRSAFHGLSIEAGKHIAAYVLANTGTAVGHPYDPPFQPCPNADVVDARDWPFACTYKDILPYDIGMWEGLFGSDGVSAADFAPDLSDTRAWRNQRIHLPLLDWSQWLPSTHPMDSYGRSEFSGVPAYPYWPTSIQKTAYDQLRAGYTPHCPGVGCLNENDATGNPGAVAWYGEQWSKIGGRGLTIYKTGAGAGGPCIGGYPPDFDCVQNGDTTVTNNLVRIGYSAAQWSATKMLEIVDEFDLARYGNNYYPDAGTGRVVAWVGAFGQSPNLLRIIKSNGIPGLEDGSPAAEKFISMQWYQLAAILNPNKNRWGLNTIEPLDVGYTHGYFKDLYFTGGVRLPFLTTQWIQQNTRRLINRVPDTSNSQSSWRGLDLINPTLITSPDFTPSWLAVQASERQATHASVADAVYTAFWDVVAGNTANGTGGTFTTGQWSYWNGNTWDNTNLGIAGNSTLGRAMWHTLAYGQMVNSTTRQLVANTLGPAIIGARNWATALAFTACSWNNTLSKIVRTSDNSNCDGAAPAP